MNKLMTYRKDKSLLVKISKEKEGEDAIITFMPVVPAAAVDGAAA